MKFLAFLTILLLATVALAAPQSWTWSGTITDVKVPSVYAPTLTNGDTFSYNSLFDPAMPSFPPNNLIALYNGGEGGFRPVAFTLGSLGLKATHTGIWWLVSDPSISWPPNTTYPYGTRELGSNGQFWLPTDQPNQTVYAGKFLISCGDSSRPYAYDSPQWVNKTDLPKIGQYDTATITLDFAGGRNGHETQATSGELRTKRQVGITGARADVCSALGFWVVNTICR